MSATPSWAMTEPSMYSTMECTMDCGWTRTPICSGSRSNSHRASMISSPLFMSVAESVVIFAPIFQVGCFNASAAVTWASAALESWRNGPPEAVRTMRRTGARLWPWRHWKTALCSESTGRSATLRARAAPVMRRPAMTSVSLLASAMFLPAWIAAIVGSSPAAPTRAESTTSASLWAASVTSPSAPARSSGRGCGSSRARASTAVGSRSATACGRYRRQSSARSGTLEPRAASPATESASGKAETSSSVRLPTEPVAPSSVIFFMTASRPNEPHVIEEGRSVEQQAIQPIEQPAVAGDQRPGVLGSDAPLERRLDEVAELADHAQEEARDHGAPEPDFGDEPHLGDERGQHGDHELGRGAFDGLPRAE